MKIINEIEPLIRTFQSLSLGDMFLVDNDLYLKVGENPTYNAFYLEKGFLCTCRPTVLISKVEVEIHIKSIV